MPVWPEAFAAFAFSDLALSRPGERLGVAALARAIDGFLAIRLCRTGFWTRLSLVPRGGAGTSAASAATKAIAATRMPPATTRETCRNRIGRSLSPARVRFDDLSEISSES